MKISAHTGASHAPPTSVGNQYLAQLAYLADFQKELDYMAKSLMDGQSQLRPERHRLQELRRVLSYARELFMTFRAKRLSEAHVPWRIGQAGVKVPKGSSEAPDQAELAKRRRWYEDSARRVGNKPALARELLESWRRWINSSLPRYLLRARAWKAAEALVRNGDVSKLSIYALGGRDGGGPLRIAIYYGNEGFEVTPGDLEPGHFHAIFEMLESYEALQGLQQEGTVEARKFFDAQGLAIPRNDAQAVAAEFKLDSREEALKGQESVAVTKVGRAIKQSTLISSEISDLISQHTAFATRSLHRNV